MSGRISSGKIIIINFIWKFMERTGVQLTNLVVQMVLARLIAPEDFASVAIIMAFITIANLLVQSGLGTALVQSKEVSETDYCTVFYTNLLIAVVIMILLHLAAPWIASYYNLPVLVELIRWQSIIILTGAFNVVQVAILSREMHFKKNFFASITGCVLSGVISIILAYMGLGVWAIIILNITNNCIYSIVLWNLVKWRPKLKFSRDSMRRLYSFGWKLLVATLIGAIYDNLRTLIIGKVYPKNMLAYYNKADVVSASLMNGITGSISAIMLPVLSRNQDDEDTVKSMLRKTCQINCFICVPMMFGLAAVGENLIVVLFSEPWREAGIFLSIICIGYSFYPMHSANLQAIYAMGRSDIALKLEIIKRVIGILLIIASIPLGVYAVTISVVIMSLISTGINSFPNKKLLNYDLVAQIKDIWMYFFISIIMSAAVVVIGMCIKEYLNLYFLLLIQIVTGMAIYVLLCCVFRPWAFKYLCNMFFKRK